MHAKKGSTLKPTRRSEFDAGLYTPIHTHPPTHRRTLTVIELERQSQALHGCHGNQMKIIH